MSEEIKNDCYWFVKETENESCMAACCVACGEKHNLGMFWEGSLRGYGSYDLNCEMCNTVIHKQHGK